MDVTNLRRDLPRFNTSDLLKEYINDGLGVLRLINEMGVPCAMSMGTRQMLFQTIRAMGAKTVLDIGTYCGTSACAFALAVGHGGRAVTVDIKDALASDGFWKQAGRSRPSRLMEMAGVSERVEFVQRDSREFLRTTAEKFDFISIDGWHDPRCVYEEIILAVTRLNPGGLIFLDDVMQVQDGKTVWPGGDPSPESHDAISGPYDAIYQHVEEAAPLRVHHVTENPDGQWTATAFLLRR